MAAAYAALRFYYYAIMLGTSPYRARRDILDKLYADGAPPGSRIPMYFGPSKFTTSPWYQDHGRVEEQAEVLRGAFPKFAGGRVIAEPTSNEGTDEQGETYLSWAVDCRIPVRCRIAGLIEDLDYTIPIWLNLAGLTWFAWQVLR